MAFQVFDFCGAFEITRIDNTDLDENEILKDTREHAQNPEKGVQTQAVKAVDQDNGRFGFLIELRNCSGWVGALNLGCGHEIIEVSQVLRGLVVMPLNQKSGAYQQGCDQQGNPTAFEKLDRAERNKDKS